MALPACCLGISFPSLGSGVPSPEGRGFGGVLSWWVGRILRQRGPHRTPALSGPDLPAFPGDESTGSRDEQSLFRDVATEGRALCRHPWPPPPHPFHPCSQPQGLYPCYSL